MIKNKLYWIGAMAGAVAGYLYWKYVGCHSDTCAITSKPYSSAVYFAMMGALVFGLFKKEQRQEPKLNNDEIVY